MPLTGDLDRFERLSDGQQHDGVAYSTGINCLPAMPPNCTDNADGQVSVLDTTLIKSIDFERRRPTRGCSRLRSMFTFTTYDDCREFLIDPGMVAGPNGDNRERPLLMEAAISKVVRRMFFMLLAAFSVKLSIKYKFRCIF